MLPRKSFSLSFSSLPLLSFLFSLALPLLSFLFSLPLLSFLFSPLLFLEESSWLLRVYPFTNEFVDNLLSIQRYPSLAHIWVLGTYATIVDTR